MSAPDRAVWREPVRLYTPQPLSDDDYAFLRAMLARLRAEHAARYTAARPASVARA